MNESSKKILFESESAYEAITFAIDTNINKVRNIHILPGLYYLNKTIEVPDLYTISGSGNSTRLILSKEHETGIGILTNESNKILMKDFWIQAEKKDESGKTGIILDHTGDTKITSVTCQGFSEYGIVIRNNSFLCEVSSCRFTDIDKSGIFMDTNKGDGRGGSFLPNLVTNCIVYRCGKGIELKYTIVANFIGNLIYNTKSYAFHLHTNSNSILITGCRTFQIEDDAVVVENSDEINITGNIFCWHDKNGIILKNVTWGTISGNNIIDTGNVPFEETKTEEYEYWKPIPEDISPYQFYAVLMVEKSNCLSVNGNAIFNWASNPPLIDGILEDNSCSSNIISNNNINGYSGKSINSMGENSLVSNNLGTPKPSKGNTHGLHSYDPRKIEKFIKDIE